MRPLGPIRALAWHAQYVCRRGGACCARGWPIPVEMHVAAAMRRERFDEGIVDGHLARDSTGRCVFLDGSVGVRTTCGIQSRVGGGAMPMSCRHFPRVYCLDPQGVAMVLSHACESVAGDLERDWGREHDGWIVEVLLEELPAAPEGLDGRDVMPPLLAPHVLTTWDVLGRWEEQAVDVLMGKGSSAIEALALLVDAAERLRAWRPGEVDLQAALELAFAGAHAGRCEALESSLRDAPARRALRQGVASDLPARSLPLWADAGGGKRMRGPTWEERDRGVRRFLAAHAWASWPTRMGQGVRTAVASLVLALALLEEEYSRAEGRAPLAQAALRTDLLLRHLASPIVLSSLLGRVEEGGGGIPEGLARVWR